MSHSDVDPEFAFVQAIQTYSYQPNVTIRVMTALEGTNDSIIWQYDCGEILGNVSFRLNINEFQDDIPRGVRVISTLSSFASLLARTEHRGFARRVYKARHLYGAKLYCYVDDTNQCVVANVGDVSTPGSYEELPIRYTIDPVTGEYDWNSQYLLETETDIDDIDIYIPKNDPDDVGIYATRSDGSLIQDHPEDNPGDHPDIPSFY